MIADALKEIRTHGEKKLQALKNMFAKWQDERLYLEILFLEGRLEALSGDNGQTNMNIHIRFMFHSMVSLDLHLAAPGWILLHYGHYS